MHRFTQIDAFILAGGQSSRMGRDKALLEIGGETLLARAARLLERLTASVAVVGAQRSNANFDLPFLADHWPGAGPLGAIATALMRAKNPWALVLACDMPFVTEDWLAFLCERAMSAPANSFDSLVPATANRLEPLCALYGATSLPALTKALDEGIRKVTDGLATLKIETVIENEWRRFSPDGSLFRNLNNRQDYLDAWAALEG
jgi:molybdopterin-guanine dinucleotide biosynthesis protein A